MSAELNDKQLATVLYALRYVQENYDEDRMRRSFHFEGGTDVSTITDIDELCKYLNHDVRKDMVAKQREVGEPKLEWSQMHEALDTIIAAFLGDRANHLKLPSNTQIMELMNWSAKKAGHLGVADDKMPPMWFELIDQSDKNGRRIHVDVSDNNGQLFLRPRGYGDQSSEDGSGWPVLLEIWEGQLRVVLWTDINQADPQIISMEDALEERRDGNEED